MNLKDINLKNIDFEDVLDVLGLQSKRNADFFLPAVGVFAAGFVAGCVVGLLFAPKEGRQLRQDISDGVNQGMQSARDVISQVPSKIGLGGAAGSNYAQPATRSTGATSGRSRGTSASQT